MCKWKSAQKNTTEISIITSEKLFRMLVNQTRKCDKEKRSSVSLRCKQWANAYTHFDCIVNVAETNATNIGATSSIHVLNCLLRSCHTGTCDAKQCDGMRSGENLSHLKCHRMELTEKKLCTTLVNFPLPIFHGVLSMAHTSVNVSSFRICFRWH